MDLHAKHCKKCNQYGHTDDCPVIHPAKEEPLRPSDATACSPRIPTPITDQSWASWPYAGPGMSVHDGRRLERDRHKLLQMCERAYSICIGDREPSDMDDWVTDYNETKREISLENADVDAPITAP